MMMGNGQLGCRRVWRLGLFGVGGVAREAAQFEVALAR